MDDWIHVSKDLPFNNEVVKCKYISNVFNGYCIINCLEILGKKVSIPKWYNRQGEVVAVAYWKRDLSLIVTRSDLLDLED